MLYDYDQCPFVLLSIVRASVRGVSKLGLDRAIIYKLYPTHHLLHARLNLKGHHSIQLSFGMFKPPYPPYDPQDRSG